MNTNPYSPPDDPSSFIDARARVRGPAIGVTVVAILSMACFSLTLLFSGFLLVSGTAGRMQQPEIGISKEAQIAVRMLWTSGIMVANVVILIGAIKMLRLRSYSFARLSAILAVIPCIGPCYILGIPFGIWALIVLKSAGVKEAFR